jgi:hypothetical protein
MQVVSLTGPQQTQAASLKAALATAQSAHVAARDAYQNYLEACAAAGSPPVASFHKLVLTDDGTAIIAM